MSALLYANNFFSSTPSPDKPICVLLHGLFGMSSNLLAIAKGLAAYCNPIVFDLPNHGLSPTLEECDFIAMAEMLDASITHHKRILHNDESVESAKSKVHVLGHSLGGKLAMVYALQYPEKTASVVVMDIAPVSYPPYHQNIINGIKEVLSKKASTRNEAVDLLAPHCTSIEEARFLAKSFDFNDDTPENPVSAKIRIHQIEKYYAELRAFPYDVLQGKIFTEDMLLLRAEKSEYFEENYYEETEKYFPAWELEEVPDSGHNIHIDNYKYTMNALLNFYSQII